MKISNKKKFLVRMLEIAIVILTIILTIIAIKQANKLRGYRAFGGEYLIPALGMQVLIVIEDIYQTSEKHRKRGKHERY